MRIEDGIVVFITGGAVGLGIATALRLHEQGAQIAIADINVEAMKALHAKL